jgi:molybdopterin-guanine dinucleotide biosynthesis protein A
MSIELSNVDLGNVTLAVLAGGAGSRMGRPKGELTIGGKTILEHLLDRLKWPGPTLLVTAPGREHPPGWERFDVEATDPVADCGPLRGVLTALENTTSSKVVVTPIDMPAITLTPLSTLISRLRDNADTAAVMVERIVDGASRLEPLPAAFRSLVAADVIRRQLDSGNLALHALANNAHVDRVRCADDWPPDFWMNLNYPADLERISSRLQ